MTLSRRARWRRELLGADRVRTQKKLSSVHPFTVLLSPSSPALLVTDRSS